MLTKDHVIRLYQEGLEIRLKRKPHPDGIKGEYDLDKLEANVFLPALESRFDRDITILHEAIHARDEEKAARSKYPKDKEVELEAVRTYLRRPYVLELIKQLYRTR